MAALGQVGDESHGYAHIDASPDGDGEHRQEQGPPRAGAGLVEIPLGHGFVCLAGVGRRGGKTKEAKVSVCIKQQVPQFLPAPGDAVFGMSHPDPRAAVRAKLS